MKNHPQADVGIVRRSRRSTHAFDARPGSRIACVAALALGALVPSCKDDAATAPAVDTTSREPEPAKVARELGADAASFGEEGDPPAPSGNLKVDLDRFVDVDRCVAEHAAGLDPLVFDAMNGLGYDTFVRDACRLLHAAKDRDAAACEKIDASALRSKCLSWVAMLAETPERCPLAFRNEPAHGRAVTCVAVAAKDPRLCAGEMRAADRATCEALTTRLSARCERLLPRERATCTREVERWRELLRPPLEGLPPLAAPRAKLVLRPKEEAGSGGSAASESDVSTPFERGVVVVTRLGRARVDTDLAGDAPSLRFAASPNRAPRFGLGVAFSSAEGTKEEAATLGSFTLEIPGAPPVVCDATSTEVAAGVGQGASKSSEKACDLRLVRATVDRTRGGKFDAKVTGTVRTAGRTYDVDAELSTFVRDVVEDDSLHSRTFAPAHPRLTPTP